MQYPPAFLLGDHSMILHRNPKKSQVGWLLVCCWNCLALKKKRSTCDHKCLFQDHFKAVMLAHQYNRVSRIAWLCSRKCLWAFLTVFLLSGVWCKTDSCITGLYIVKKKSYLVSGEIQEGYSMWPIMLQRILPEPYIIREKEGLTNRSSYPN